jgi:hypothetical protein
MLLVDYFYDMGCFSDPVSSPSLANPKTGTVTKIRAYVGLIRRDRARDAGFLKNPARDMTAGAFSSVPP